MALVLRAGVLHKECAYIPLIAAEYCGVKVERVNALEKRWVLQTPDGPVFESNSMARYIAKSKGDSILYGSSVYEYAQVEEWMEFALKEIEEGLRRWIYPRKGLGACDPFHCMETRIVCVRHSLGVLNTHLARNNNYLVGNRITLADIAMTCTLHFGFTRIMEKSFTSEFPYVEQYFWNLVAQPNFKKVLGEVKQAESLPPRWPVVPQVLDHIFVDPEMDEARKKVRETIVEGVVV